MFDPTKVTSRAIFRHPETFLAACLDPESSAIYCGSYDWGIHRFKLDGDKLLNDGRWQRHTNYVSSLAIVRPREAPSSSRSTLISGGYDGKLIWSDAESGKSLREVAAHDGWLRRLLLLPGGERFVTVGDDMLVKLWESASGKQVRVFEGHATRTPQGHLTALYTVAASPDGKLLASGDRIGDVRVWETDSGKTAARFQTPVLYTYDPKERHRSIGGIRSLAFSPDGKYLAVGGIGQVGNVDGLAGPATVEIWDWRSQRRIVSLGAEKHKALVNVLLFHPTEPWLIGTGGGGDNGLLAIWNLTDLPKLAQADKPDDRATLPVHRIKFDGHGHDMLLSKDAVALYIAGYGRLEVWRMSR